MIQIDYGRDNRLHDYSKKLLTDYYLADGETSPQEAFARAALAYCTNSYGSYSEKDYDFAQRIYDYASRGWFMFASPVLSNAPKDGEKPRALPISCYLTYVDDSLEGLIDHTSELRWLSVKGGGVGAHWSDIRAVSKKAPGPIPFLKTVDADIVAYKQGSTRKGSYASYMDCSHPDILEFLSIRTPTGGDVNRKCFNLHIAINITDDFMEAVVKDLPWDLVDPHDGSVRDTVQARDIWNRVLETRGRTGEPYLCFIDTANRHLPQCQIDKGLRINGSNLCSEIFLATSSKRTAVCCLSSVNLELFNEWEPVADVFIPDMIRLLDNVLTVFIDNCPPTLKRARDSAIAERSLGLGAMGFHSYLQKNMIPWESSMASMINRHIFSTIHTHAIAATKQLGKERGEFPDAYSTLEVEVEYTTSQGIIGKKVIELLSNKRVSLWQPPEEDWHSLREVYPYALEEDQWFYDHKDELLVFKRILNAHSHTGYRNAHCIAIAPNANSAICNNFTSFGVEPWKSNAFSQRTRAGTTLVENKHLLAWLRKNRPDQYEDYRTQIIQNDGSIANTNLPQEVKDVFKTAAEINQEWVISHAGSRQPYICQGQSINLFFPSDADKHYVNKVHLQAYKEGLKSLYYLRTDSGAKADKISIKKTRIALGDYLEAEECIACEG